MITVHIDNIHEASGGGNNMNFFEEKNECQINNEH